MTADDIVTNLGLSPHPEGGWYRQTWSSPGQGRPAATCIHFLLRSGEQSHWHRVDADEVWAFHAGAPLVLRMAEIAAGPAQALRLGADLSTGNVVHAVVPAGWWQAAATTGDWSLVSCVVAPGFRFDGFELAPPGFDIP